MTHHENHPGSHGRQIRRPDWSGACIDTNAICPDCQQTPRIFSGSLAVISPEGMRVVLQGVSLQRCGCGTVRMKPHREVPIDIPVWMKGEHSVPGQRQLVQKKCEICGALHTAQKKSPARTCSMACLRELRIQEGKGRVPRKRRLRRKAA